MSAVVAMVGDVPITIDEVDEREAALRAGRLAATLPRAGTSEGRQLRRWVTQLLVTERVVAAEAAALGLRVDGAPTEDELLPDASTRMEIGSIAAAALADPLGRALFAHITAAVQVSEDEVADYHARNPARFEERRYEEGWHSPVSDEPSREDVRPQIVAHLRAAARRRAFRVWLDARRAALAELTPGYEHPGDPRQPDNTHRH